MSRVGVDDRGDRLGSSKPLYYRNSGRVDISGTLVSLLVSLIAGIAMAIVYALAMRSVPSEELCFIVCVIFGVMVGLIPAWLMHKFKVRNLAVMLTVVMLVTAAAYYVAWVVWEATFVHGHAIRAVRLLWRNPQLVYNLAVDINHDGAWSLGSGQQAVTGIPLTLTWLAEAATIFGAAYIAAKTVFSRAIFCENCRQWCPGPKTLRVTAPVDTQILQSSLEASDYSFVPALQPAKGGESLTFMRQSCPTCDGLHTLSVTSRQTKVDRKGRQRSKVRTIVDRLIVDPAGFELLANPAETP